AAGGRRQDCALLLHVRAEILLDEDHAGGERIRAAAGASRNFSPSPLRGGGRLSEAERGEGPSGPVRRSFSEGRSRNGRDGRTLPRRRQRALRRRRRPRARLMADLYAKALESE